MPLQEEIDARRRLLKSDRYAMSIGELMNLYQSKELDLHPDFQRFFRWSEEQKAKLIESILLGIPLPPVFVSQRRDGVWDVIDGLQRLSAIFQFAGILRDQAGQQLPPLVLTKAKYLPSLQGKFWEDIADPENPNALTPQQRIDIKRSKLDVNIILRESNADAKYDMFERLNTGGTTLSEQEVRNCLLLMSNKEFFAWIEELSLHPSFTSAVSITDRAKEERYDMELVVRFIALRTINPNELRGLIDLGSFLTDRIIALSTSAIDLQTEGALFRKTFDLLEQSLGDASFRRYDAARDRFMGPSLVSAYEVLAIGLGHRAQDWNLSDGDKALVREIAKSIWSNPAFTTHQGSGVRGTDRIQHTIPLGRQLFLR